MNGRSRKAEYRVADSSELSEGYAKLSKKAAGSARGLVIAAAIVIIVADIFALALMLFQKLGYPYILFPSILIGADGLFLLFAIFTNFRFRYSEVLIVCYFLVVATVSALFLSEGSTAEKTYFTYAGIGIFVVPHAFMWFALWWTSRLAKNPSFRKRKAATVAAIALISVAAAGFGLLRVEFGTFGQNDTVERAVVYRLNDEGDAYIASGVLNGRGSSVTVAETFNGKAVEGVDCAMFQKDDIENVRIQSEKQLILYNQDSLREKNPAVCVTVSRNVINDVQSQIFVKAKSEKDNLIGDFLRQIVPEVEENEVFVTFVYDFKTLPFKAEPIPAYIGMKNSVFTAENLGSVYQNLYENRDDLQWNYFQNGRQRLKTLKTDNGSLKVGENLTKSVRNATVAFERVYSVARSYGIYRYDGEWVSSLYATETEMAGCLDYKRAGCTATWHVTASGVKSAVVSTEREFSEYLSAAGDVEIVRLTAQWLVNKPKIEVRSDAAQNTFTYGDNVTVSAETKPHDLKISYRLLSSDGKNVIEDWKDEPRFSMSRLVPKQSGSFTVVARAVDAYDSRLYSESAKTITLTVKKKTLDFDWTLPKNSEYDGTVKKVYVKSRSEQLVGSDEISYALSETVKNAKTYRLFVKLSKESAEKYEISETTGRKEYIVTPKRVLTIWNESVYIYNGQPQSPDASAFGVASDGSIEVTVTGVGKNAGEYVAKAETQNGNYLLENAEKAYTIQKREVTAVWTEKVLTYNGRGQHPKVQDVGNAVAGETRDIIAKLVLSGGNAVNAGSGYTVTATLPEDSNYRFASEQTVVYEITKAPLAVKAADCEKIYDGKNFTDFSVSADGLVGTDFLLEVLNFTFEGTAVTAVGVGAYPISLSYQEGEKCGNYNVTLKYGVLSIQERPIIVSAVEKSKIYDNKRFTGFSVTVSNLAEGDALAEVGTVSYSGSALTAIYVSDDFYTYYPRITVSDRGEKYGNYSISFRESTLKILKKQIHVKTFGGIKTYDGTPFTAFSYETDSLADGDILADVVSFGYRGAAVGEVNAGNYAVVAEVAAEGAKYKNYLFVFTESSVVIEPRELSISAKNATKVYDNKPYAFGEQDYEVTGLAQTDSLSEVLSVAFAGDAVTRISGGTYEYRLVLGTAVRKFRNYNVTFGGAKLAITKRNATVSAVDKEKIYDGKVFTGFSVTAELAEGDTIAVLGKITYTGDAVTAVNASDHPYAYLPQITDGDKGAKFESCYLVTFEGASLTIAKRDASVTAENGEKVYDGKGFEGFSVKTDNFADGETFAMLGTAIFGGEAVSAIDAGSYTVTVSVETPTEKYGNYNLRFVAGTVTIAPRELVFRAAETMPEIWKIYDGTTECDFNFRYGTHFVLDGAELVSGEITGVEIVSAVFNDSEVYGAGNVTVTFGKLFTGAGYKEKNYSYSAGKTLVYNAAIRAREVSVTWLNTTAFYTGTFQKPLAAATGEDGKALPLAVTVDGNADGALNAGRYRATATCADRNYALLDFERSFEIERAAAEVQWGAETIFEFNGAPIAPEATAKGVNGETVSVSVRVKKGSTDGTAVNVGTYTAVAETDNPNYRLTKEERNFEIVPKNVAIRWENLNVEYNGKEQIPTAAATFVDGDRTLEVSFVGGGSKRDAGTYDVTVTVSDGNYRLSNTSQKFVIAPKTVAVLWGGENEYVYDGTAHAPSFTVAGADGETVEITPTFLFNDTETVTEAVETGSYTLAVATPNRNYNLTNAEFRFKIVPVTSENVSVICASDATEAL